MRTEQSNAQRWLVAWICGALPLLACQEATHARPLDSRGADCVSCHADERTATNAPAHAQAGFGDDCGGCHDEQRWQPAPGFLHVASFALVLGHADLPCASCHASYARGATTDVCAGCHAADAGRVIDPDHTGLPGDCSACHRTDAFWPARFVHSWPLMGKHALTSCRSCHGRSEQTVYETTSSSCMTCHRQDRARADAASPQHGQVADACNDCHGFDHFRDVAARAR